MNWFFWGLLLILAGGAMQGSFTIPQKHIQGWPWAMGWLFYSIVAMLVCPWLIVMATIPSAAAVYSSAGFAPLALAGLFGAGWGVGSVLFGLGVARVGTALAFGIIISLTAAVGSVVPLVLLHPDQLIAKRGLLLLLGLALVILGVVWCAKAGALREAVHAGSDRARAPREDFRRGLAICVASGISSPMINLSLAFGDPISSQAIRCGANPANASIAVLAVAVTAGFLINAGYCLYLLGRNGLGKRVSAVQCLCNFLFCGAMGFLWMFGLYFYGLGATRLGAYGSALGWPVFTITMVLTANFLGILTGEWQTAGRNAVRYLSAGIGAMVAAMIVISAATTST